MSGSILSQFQNSPTIVSLVESLEAYIDPKVNLDAFYNLVMNVLADGATLNTYGLDVWGRIVGVSRNLNIPADIVNPGGYSFTAGTYVLDNPSFRTLILIKALANITDCSIPSLNGLLSKLFAGRGRTYVIDHANMTMDMVFEFYLLPFEYAIVSASLAVPHPAGVLVNIIQIGAADTFGFDGSDFQPFDQGTFF
jgi:hypothetical protein